MLLVSDANIFIDLYNIGLLEEFDKLNIKIATSDFVFNELNDIQKDIIQTLDIEIYGLESAEMVTFMTQYKSLGQLKISYQDYSVFYIAKKYNGQLLTNDKALRKFAKSNMMEIKGIFYILDLIIEQSNLDKQTIINALDLLLKNSWLPKNEILKRIDSLK